MNLPSGSSLTYLTLENPWPAGIGLIVIGCIVLQAATKQKSFRTGGLIALGGVALIALATWYETTAERLVAKTTQLVETAIDSGSSLKIIDDMFAPDLIVTFGRDQTTWGKAEIMERIPWVRELVSSNNLRQVDAVRLTKDTAESVFAQTTGTTYGYPTPNEWRCYWRREADGTWVIEELVWERWNLNEIPSARLFPGPGR